MWDRDGVISNLYIYFLLITRLINYELLLQEYFNRCNCDNADIFSIVIEQLQYRCGFIFLYCIFVICVCFKFYLLVQDRDGNIEASIRV